MGDRRMFNRYIGIDYSGAATPTTPLDRFAVFRAQGGDLPERICSDQHHRGWWTRRAAADWLVGQLQEQGRTLVGIDHAFSFPIRYFDFYDNLLGPSWDDFLDDFQRHWPTDGDDVSVRSQYSQHIRRMMGITRGVYRFGVPDWYRLTESRSPRDPSSVFDFNAGARTVAYHTHAGLPWLRYIRRRLKEEGVEVHFWPFDDWVVPQVQSVVVEVYPSLWNGDFPNETNGMSNDERDAYSVARWMSETDRGGLLRQHFDPVDTNDPRVPERHKDQARKEGWFFGLEYFN